MENNNQHLVTGMFRDRDSADRYTQRCSEGYYMRLSTDIFPIGALL